MDEIPLLHDIVVIFGLSVVVLLVMYRIHLPAVVGFLCTGLLCGPHALGLVRHETDVQVLANIGIVLLLFIVGMEFSFKKILEYRRYFLIGGTFQVGLTVIFGAGVALVVGAPFSEAFFLGFLLSLSSTAIVLRLLADKMESDSPHGRIIVGMMIFQDIIAIPMMLSIPLLTGGGRAWDSSFAWAILQGVGALGLVLFSAEKLVPHLLYRIARTRSRELFILSVFTLCFSVVWLTSSMGLSVSLGAFLAGLIISESEYRTEAIGDILPFQDIFTSFFFVSIGMLLNVGFVLQQPLLILSMAAGIMLLKASAAGFSAFVLGMPLRTVVLTGIAMSQIGEFSFVLAKEGAALHLGSDYHHQLFLAVALITMAVTPTLMSVSPWIATNLLRLPLSNRIKSGLKTNAAKTHPSQQNHIIIVGFGISGRNLARSAREATLPYVVLEMNPETVKKEKLNGEPIHFGDASHDSVLNHANIAEAFVLAIVINDTNAAMRIVETARKLNPKLHIVVRTRYLRELKTMYNLGADEVVPDEFGSSIEVFTRVLRAYHVPTEKVQQIVSGVRIEGYEMLRLLYKEPTSLSDISMIMADVVIEAFRVQSSSSIVDKTLEEVGMRKKHQLTALLVRRGEHCLTSLNAETVLKENDVVVLVGTPDNLERVIPLFQSAASHDAISRSDPVAQLS